MSPRAAALAAACVTILAACGGEERPAPRLALISFFSLLDDFDPSFDIVTP